MNKFNRVDKKYLYWGITAFLVIIACIAFFWVIQRWSGFRDVVSNLNAILSPFVIGFVIAYLLTPLVKLLQSRLMDRLSAAIFKKSPQKAKAFSRGFSVFLALLLLLGFVAALFSIIIPQMYKSIESIVLNLSDSIARADKWAKKWLDDYPEIEALFVQFVGDIGTAFSTWAKNTLLPGMQDVVTVVSAGVINILKGLLNILVALVVSVYIMHSREKFVGQGKKVLYSLLSVKWVNKILRAMRFINKSFMSFFTGKLLDSLIIGVICYVGCLIIGIRDSLLISVIIGVTNIIPFFGPFIGAVPSALIVLMSSYVQCIIFVIFIIILQQFDGNILGPKILGNATGLSGFWVMFALLVGSGLLGPIGLIVGVPLFAVIYAWLKNGVRGKLKKRGLPTETAIYAGLDHIDPESGEPVPFDGEEAEGPGEE